MAYLPMLAEEESRAALLDMLSKGWYILSLLLSASSLIMFCSGELCDLTVVCQETHRSYRVHAMVMLSMSGLFRGTCSYSGSEAQGAVSV